MKLGAGVVLLEGLWAVMSARLGARSRAAIAIAVVAIVITHTTSQLVELDRLARLPDPRITGS